MKDLIERLERASGPDRGLDGEIYCLDPVVAPLWPHWTLFQREELTPRYTASLDAAMTLLPGGIRIIDLQLSWDTDQPPSHPAVTIRWYPPERTGKEWHALVKSGATPPLTLAAGALEMRRRMAETAALHSRSVEEPKE